MRPILALARIALLSLTCALGACRPTLPAPEQPPNPMPPGPVAQAPFTSGGISH